jgi:hypothetical protein
MAKAVRLLALLVSWASAHGVATVKTPGVQVWSPKMGIAQRHYDSVRDSPFAPPYNGDCDGIDCDNSPAMQGHARGYVEDPSKGKLFRHYVTVVDRSAEKKPVGATGDTDTHSAADRDDKDAVGRSAEKKPVGATGDTDIHSAADKNDKDAGVGGTGPDGPRAGIEDAGENGDNSAMGTTGSSRARARDGRTRVGDDDYDSGPRGGATAAGGGSGAALKDRSLNTQSSSNRTKLSKPSSRIIPGNTWFKSPSAQRPPGGWAKPGAGILPLKSIKSKKASKQFLPPFAAPKLSAGKDKEEEETLRRGDFIPPSDAAKRLLKPFVPPGASPELGKVIADKAVIASRVSPMKANLRGEKDPSQATLEANMEPYKDRLLKAMKDQAEAKMKTKGGKKEGLEEGGVEVPEKGGISGLPKMDIGEVTKKGVLDDVKKVGIGLKEGAKGGEVPEKGGISNLPEMDIGDVTKKDVLDDVKEVSGVEQDENEAKEPGSGAKGRETGRGGRGRRSNFLHKIVKAVGKVAEHHIHQEIDAQPS